VDVTRRGPPPASGPLKPDLAVHGIDSTLIDPLRGKLQRAIMHWFSCCWQLRQVGSHLLCCPKSSLCPCLLQSQWPPPSWHRMPFLLHALHSYHQHPHNC
jgi:hypothetical protein